MKQNILLILRIWTAWKKCAGTGTEALCRLWEDRALTEAYAGNCRDVTFDTVEAYCGKLMKIYEG